MKSFVTSNLRRQILNKSPLFQTSKFFSQTNGVCLIRKQAPKFGGMSWWNNDFKKVSLEDFQGKWVCLFFYPLDFTFVCPTEIVDFETASKEFHRLSKLKFFNFFRLSSNRLQR